MALKESPPPPTLPSTQTLVYKNLQFYLHFETLTVHNYSCLGISLITKMFEWVSPQRLKEYKYSENNFTTKRLYEIWLTAK